MMTKPPASTFILIVCVAVLVQSVPKLTSSTEPKAELEDVDILETPSPTERKHKRNFRPGVHYKASVERPLFTKSRRPKIAVQETAETPKQEEQKQVVAKPEDLNFAVHGIMVTESNKSALVSVNDGEKKWVKERQRINDWLLLEINPQAIVLEKNEHRKSILLYQK